MISGNKIRVKTNLKEISGYLCPFCGEFFRTNNHSCRRDPSVKTCKTCKHLGYELGGSHAKEYPYCTAQDMFLIDIKSIGSTEHVYCEHYEQKEQDK